MKFNSIIKGNHCLKKNGYKIIKKLHKLERKKGAKRAYMAVVDDTYFFVLACRNLIELIEMEYKNYEDDKLIEEFKNKSDSFIKYLDYMAENRKLINKHVLASYLKAYTKFFNKIIKENYKFNFNQEMVEIWNQKCLMAYIATWGIH
jgi:hypothetical protein